MANEISKLADAIGLPDKEDKERIERWINRYNEQHPGEFKFHRDAARVHLKDPGFAIVDKQSARRYLFELPVPFGNWMGQAYPLMFKDKKHFRWFCDNFKYLLIPEKW